MTGLSGTRVILVDDDPRDALPVLKAFAKKGIAAAFFDGSIQGLPPTNQSLVGVRLAILDMDLIGGGASEQVKAAALVKRLERILSPKNGPYVALLWTNQPELQNQFESYSYLSKKLPNPILSVLLTKAECKTNSGNFKLPVLAKKLEDALVQTSPLLLLKSWEEKCFNAATDVTNSLSELAQPNATSLPAWRAQWKDQLLNLMHAMARAEMGMNLDSDTCTDGLYGALNPLHADRMESYSSTLSVSLAQGSDEILGAPENTTTGQKAEVNTMLHLAFENLSRHSPGNLYAFATKKIPQWIASNKELAADLAHSGQQEIANSSWRVLIETSAVCDHAQKNVRVPRFITGLLVPANGRKKMKRSAPFVFEFGPVHLKRPAATKDGDYYLYFSARHQVTCKLSELATLTAVARLRTQALSDLQAWYSRQSARPGMVMLTEK